MGGNPCSTFGFKENRPVGIRIWSIGVSSILVYLKRSNIDVKRLVGFGVDLDRGETFGPIVDIVDSVQNFAVSFQGVFDLLARMTM